ncbi:hypothetical protein KFK09_013712 [Dendrobium nobile]|uniref:Uncharacterized protein n=1 Tax=Dendrobium nobile TaxID=94219 RepID=A0A8T3BB00_DENNO|nr:hypothetical protein KFK09_013712 [Dendrobium nobile]
MSCSSSMSTSFEFNVKVHFASSSHVHLMYRSSSNLIHFDLSSEHNFKSLVVLSSIKF